MERYSEKIVGREDLFTKYDSFMFLEGQKGGLPEDVEELYKYLIDGFGLEVWLIGNLFDHPERIKTVPILNPDVIVFQTTMLNREQINDFIDYLEGMNWKPKEIWQLINNDIPIVDSDKYDVFSFYLDSRVGKINLIKL